MRNIKIFLIVSFILIFGGALIYSFSEFQNSGNYSIWYLPAIILLVFIFYYFFILQLLNRYISDRISKILNEAPFNKNQEIGTIVTDMNDLSREVERFARDKQQEIEVLRIRENYRKEFLGNVAHELKTPLFTVQGYIFTLIDGAKDDPVILNNYLNGAAKGIDRLVNIVGNLDMISELEYGGLRLEKTKFDSIELIKNVLELLEIKTEKKNISVTFDREYLQPIFVKADKDKIEQVLINIIENSFKYGKKNGTTEVAIDNLSDSKILIRITDNGEGISKENLPRVFERFYRVDKSGSRKEGGSGLGLSIVKHIIEAHQEKIYVESQFGVGSEFSFTLSKAEV